MQVSLVRVDIVAEPGLTSSDPTRYVVHPVYAGVDRRSCSMSCGINKKTAERLKAACLAGKAVPLTAELATDVLGKKYANYSWNVLGRYLNADLKRLGF